MDPKNLLAKLHPLERKVLPLLKETSSFSELPKKSHLSEVEVMRAIQWLENKKIITTETKESQCIILDSNGEEYRKKGLPETRFLKELSKAKKASLQDILGHAGLKPEEGNICLGTLRKKVAIAFSEDKKITLTPQGENLLKKESLEEQFLKKEFPIAIDALSPEERFAVDSLKTRKAIIKVESKKTITVTLTALGKELLTHSLSSSSFVDTVTPDMLKKESWNGKTFRHYDIKINVPKIHGAKRHFVNQSIISIKKIWLELGFQEMSGNLVQTSFWDLDALFVPQDHPARSMQDTFYLKDPKYGTLPKGFHQKVKETHENGGKTGSTGWGYAWDEKTAKENLLRTHTTVLSAQTIARLKKEDIPAKFFSVNKVFRNEALTWKHLFEFHQVEGIVIDPNATLSDLKGYLRTFYTKLGFTDVRMRPGHFPYTEPSLEVDVFHPVKKAWVELGGAGIFRPEVVKPLLGMDVTVLAWGQGLERGIMDYFALQDIRDVYKNDLKQIREMKIWR